MIFSTNDGFENEEIISDVIDLAYGNECGGSSTNVSNNSIDDALPFTPPLMYSRKPDDYILKIGGEEISLVQLKSLDINLNPDEVNICKAVNPNFNFGCLFDAIVNSFFYSG